MKHPFVCVVCRKPVDYHGNRYEERVEIRKIDRSESFASKTIAYYCKHHAIARRDELKGTSADNQGALL